MSEPSVPSHPSSLYAIEKLSSTNFHAWKVKVQLVLMDRQLWEYVKSGGTELKMPDVEKEQVKWKEWNNRNNAALAQIGLTLQNTEISYVTNVTKASEAWKAICEVYEANSTQARVFAKRKFFT